MKKGANCNICYYVNSDGSCGYYGDYCNYLPTDGCEADRRCRGCQKYIKPVGCLEIGMCAVKNRPIKQTMRASECESYQPIPIELADNPERSFSCKNPLNCLARYFDPDCGGWECAAKDEGGCPDYSKFPDDCPLKEVQQ